MVLPVMKAPRALRFSSARSAIWAKWFRNASWSNSGAGPVPVAVSTASTLEDGLSFPNKRDARPIRGVLGSLVGSNMKLDRYASMASSTLILSVPSIAAKMLGRDQRRFRQVEIRDMGAVDIPAGRCAAYNVEYFPRQEGIGGTTAVSIWGGVQLRHDLPEDE